MVKFTNYYNLPIEEIYDGFKKVFSRNSLDLDCSNIQINPWHDVNSKYEGEVCGQWEKLDCEYGRILTATGIYTCPFLANDYRGRCGSSFMDYNTKSSLETSFCNTCIKAKKQIFAIDFSQFE